ncbi:hypothetical protein L6386_05355 [bacterium]|nr:hypothetical protein [bacterium]MBU4310404.1 hypothetical protein [bacterium]MBU4561189.1 hypothetical protein [bacterium]MCG2677967.1 hypothetical protein [bacterium]
MKFSKKYLAIIGGVVLVVLVVVVAVGVKKAAHRRAIKRRRPALARLMGKEKPREMLETIRIVRTIEALELNEEQVAQIIPKWRRMKEARKEFQQSRKERIEELEKLLKSKVSSQDLEKALENLKAQEKAFRERMESLKDEIDSILTPEQEVKLILFEKQFRKEMQRMLKKPPKRASPLEKKRELRRPERRLPGEGLPLEEVR